jgi:acyl-homoserine lactone acylase PvdQ
MHRFVVTAAAAVALGVGGSALAVPSGAGTPAPDDHAAIARNIMPSGQLGEVPPRDDASRQAEMYDGLTPLLDDVTDADLTEYFKSEALGTEGQGTLTTEPDTPSGVRIERDEFHVPHIYGRTDRDVAVGAGWVLAKDRGLLLEQARYNARVAAIDAPGLTALDLIAGLETFVPSDQTEREVAKQTKALRAAGAKGRAVLRDIDAFVEGINAYYEQSGNDAEPWGRNDIYALNALKGQFVGEGGGAEAGRAMFLSALVQQFGEERGRAIFEDLRETDDPETPKSVPGQARFQRPPRSLDGNVVIDDGSYEAAATLDPPSAPAAPEGAGTQASNALLVAGDRTEAGNPIMVAGPQIGYFYPGLLLEMDLHGPSINVRGATSAPFPGYILIGRGADFAWSLTSAGLDIVDTYAETLCDGSDTRYEYRGRCRDMERFDAGTLQGDPDQQVVFHRTVHGPVVGYATVDGTRVALSRKRSSYGEDTLDQLLYRDLTYGKVRNVDDFFAAASQTPQTFNSFYVDDRDIGVFTSGRVPLRPPDVDSGLPTDGRGDHEWRGVVPVSRLPQGVNPPNGEIVNWNNKTMAGYQFNDDNWSMGAIQRVELLSDALDDGDGLTPASVTSAMNIAATQDVRVMQLLPVLAELLRGGSAPSPQAEQMLGLLEDWRENGGSRIDLDLDGKIDDPGAAIIDAAWTGLADGWASAVLGPVLPQFEDVVGRYNAPPGGQYGGWHVYMDKDLRALLGDPVKGRFSEAYCGGDDVDACRTALWAALEAAGAELAAAQGPDPTAWRADATAERIEFVPGLLPTTMRYSNRPSGIQQVISFDGHGPR